MKNSVSKWWILTAMSLLTVMLNIDVTAVNLAIPVIAKEFYASLTNLQWVISAYVLPSAMFQILGGRLGDTYGHKKLFLIGTSLFILSSAGAGLSFNEQTLIAFRALQGISLGIAFPMTIVLTLAAFSKKEQAFALGFITAAMGISLAIGPPIGGWIVNHFGWRWIFYINVPLGAVTLLLAGLFCPSHEAKEKLYIDYKGALFLTLGLLGTLLAVNQVQNWGFTSPLFLSIFSLGILSLVVLYFVDRKQSYPIVEFHLFKVGNFTLNNIIRFIVQLIFVPILFFIPLYLQNIAGYTPVYAGLVMLFLTVVIGLLSPIAGKWIDISGDKAPNILSMSLFMIGSFLFYLLGAEPDLFLLGFGLLLIGIATGISFVSTITGSISIVAEKHQGVATGIIFTTAWFGCAAGVAIVGTILALTSKSFFYKHLAVSLSSEQLAAAERVAEGVMPARSLSPYFSGENLLELKALTTASFMNGFHASMLALFLFALTGLIASLALKKHTPSRPISTLPG